MVQRQNVHKHKRRYLTKNKEEKNYIFKSCLIYTAESGLTSYGHLAVWTKQLKNQLQ